MKKNIVGTLLCLLSLSVNANSVESHNCFTLKNYVKQQSLFSVNSKDDKTKLVGQFSFCLNSENKISYNNEQAIYYIKSYEVIDEVDGSVISEEEIDVVQIVENINITINDTNDRDIVSFYLEYNAINFNGILEAKIKNQYYPQIENVNFNTTIFMHNNNEIKTIFENNNFSLIIERI